MRLDGVGRELVKAAALTKVIRRNVVNEIAVLLVEELDRHLAKACFEWTKLCGAGSNEMVIEVENALEEICRKGFGKKDN